MPKLTKKEKSNERKDARAIGYESGWNDGQKYRSSFINNVNAKIGYSDGIKSRTNHRKTKYAIPLFFLEAIFLEWADDFFVSKVDRYINTRNDQTVYSYFVTSMAAFFRKINRKIWGTFGYESVPMSISGSNLEGSQVAKGDSSFNLLYKLAYSDHFVTDSYSGFWKEAKKAALSGINQLDEFKGKVATREELKSTNGYLSNELASAADERMTDIANLGLKLEEKSKERKQKDGKK